MSPPNDPASSPQGIRIAAIIPTYQRARSISRAVESALAQHPRPEVIVVDDGSTDNTPAVLAGFGDRIRVLRKKNEGVAVARNVGAASTDADWLAFLDSDDYWTADHLNRVQDAIETTVGRSDVYFSDTRLATSMEALSLFELAGFYPRGHLEVLSDASNWVLLPRQPFMVQSAVVAHDAFDSVGGYWEELTHREDTHFFFMLGIGRSMCAVNGIGCVMTDDDTSGLRQTERFGTETAVYWVSTISMYADVLDRLGDRLSEPGKNELIRRISNARINLAKASLPNHPIAASRLLGVALLRSPTVVGWRILNKLRPSRDL